jgi:hypothetical protein
MCYLYLWHSFFILSIFTYHIVLVYIMNILFSLVLLMKNFFYSSCRYLYLFKKKRNMQLIQHHILHILLLNLTNSSLTVIKTIFSLYVYIGLVMIWASNEQSLSFSSLYNFINQSMCRKREQNDRTTYIEPTLNERDYNIPGRNRV